MLIYVILNFIKRWQSTL